MGSKVNKIFKNTVYLYGNTAFSMFVSLLSTRLILNALGKDDFGIFCIVGGAIALLGFINGGMAGATQRFINYAEGAGLKENKIKIFNASISIHLGISLISFVVLEIAFFLFFNGILNIPTDRIYAAKWIYQFSVLSTILTIQTTPYNALINAHEDLKYYSNVGFIFTFIKLIIAILIVYISTDKLILYGILTTISCLLNIIIVQTFCRFHYDECIFSPRKYFDKNIAKEMLSYASYTFLTTITSASSVYGGNIVVNNFFGTSINAAQGVASQISGQLMVFPNNLLMAINPIIGKSAGNKDYNSMIKYALTSSKLSFFILLFFAIPFILETNWIMSIWLKNIPEWAIIFCQLEVIRRLLDQLLVGLRNAISADGHIKYYSKIQSFLYILPLPITFILLSCGFQPVWLYINWILCLNIFASYNVIQQAHRYCHLNRKVFFTSLVSRCIIVAVIMAAVGSFPHFFIGPSLWRSILVGMLTSISFVISVWYLALTDIEKQIAVHIIQLIKSKIPFKNSTQS